MSHIYSVTIDQDAPTRVIEEDVQIAVLAAHEELGFQDFEISEIGGGAFVLDMEDAVLNVAVFKERLQHLDGAQTCRVTVDEVYSA